MTLERIQQVADRQLQSDYVRRFLKEEKVELALKGLKHWVKAGEYMAAKKFFVALVSSLEDRTHQMLRAEEACVNGANDEPADASRTRCDEAIARFDEVFNATVTIATSILELAGRPDLAGQLPPSIHAALRRQTLSQMAHDTPY